ncbi:hypothetical protein BKA80DRAFT_258515 [Phyllosticta citrichinensis]
MCVSQSVRPSVPSHLEFRSSLLYSATVLKVSTQSRPPSAKQRLRSKAGHHAVQGAAALTVVGLDTRRVRPAKLSSRQTSKSLRGAFWFEARPTQVAQGSRLNIRIHSLAEETSLDRQQSVPVVLGFDQAADRGAAAFGEWDTGSRYICIFAVDAVCYIAFTFSTLQTAAFELCVSFLDREENPFQSTYRSIPSSAIPPASAVPIPSLVVDDVVRLAAT